MARLDQIIRNKVQRARPYAPRSDWGRMAALLDEDSVATTRTRRRKAGLWMVWAAATLLLAVATWLGGQYAAHQHHLAQQRPAAQETLPHRQSAPIPHVSPQQTAPQQTAPQQALPQQAALQQTTPQQAPQAVPSAAPRTRGGAPAYPQQPDRNSLAVQPDLPTGPMEQDLPARSYTLSRLTRGPVEDMGIAQRPVAAPRIPGQWLEAPEADLPPAPRTYRWDVGASLASSRVPDPQTQGDIVYPGLGLQASRRLGRRWEAGLHLQQGSMDYYAYTGSQFGGVEADNATGSFNNLYYPTSVSGQMLEAGAFTRYHFRRNTQARLRPFAVAGIGQHRLSTESILSPTAIYGVSLDEHTRVGLVNARSLLNVGRNFAQSSSDYAPIASNQPPMPSQAIYTYASYYGGLGLDIRLYKGLGAQLQTSLHHNQTLSLQRSGYAYSFDPGYGLFIRSMIGLRYAF
ncbi:MAG: hypothetical protein OHK0039_01380 [Bacteroidia bacterium]